MLQASVIIPTYLRPQFLSDAVKSIAAQRLSGMFEIVVVDNCPSSELRSQVSDLNASTPPAATVRYVAEPRTGLHFARHAGARSANADLVVFCDDDILAEEGWLSAILDPFADPSIVCVGGKVAPHWEVPPPSWIESVPASYYSLLDRGSVPHIMQPGELFHGCNFAVRKKVLFDLGGFNPDGFGDRNLIWLRGDGEVGLMRKIRAKGYKVAYAPGAVIEHRIPADRMRREYLYRRAFDSGIEASYGFYRYRKSSPLGLILHIPKLIAGSLLYQLLISTGFDQERQSLRYHLRRETYRGQLHHTFRLLIRADLRQFCRRDNYLELTNDRD